MSKRNKRTSEVLANGWNAAQRLAHSNVLPEIQNAMANMAPDELDAKLKGGFGHSI